MHLCTWKYFFKKEKRTQCYFSKFHSKDNFDQMLSTTLAFIEEVSNESGEGWLIFLRNNFFQKIMKKTVDRKSESCLDFYIRFVSLNFIFKILCMIYNKFTVKYLLKWNTCSNVFSSYFNVSLNYFFILYSFTFGYLWCIVELNKINYVN